MLPESSVDNEMNDSSVVQDSSGEVAWSTTMLAQILFHAQRVHQFIVHPQVPEILRCPSPNPWLLYKFGDSSLLDSSNFISPTPAMHHLFTVKDLLFEICSYMTPADLSVAARVASDWFWCAIPHLYKDVNIRQALSPLGQISYRSHYSGGYNHYRFVEPPGDKEWERFSMYAIYVQTLNVNQNYDRAISHAISESQAKGHQYLFPNVRFLRWNTIAFTSSPKASVSSDLDALCSSLISPGITQLDLRISDRQPDFVRHVFQLLTTRLITLRSLQIDLADSADLDSRSIQKVLNFFAATLKSVAVHIPRRLVTRPGPVTEYQLLLSIPNLHNLIIHGHESSFDETLTISESYAEYSRQTRPSQRSLFFSVSVQFLYDMLSSPFDFNALTMFWWHLDVAPDEVVGFISFIITACPRLHSLILGAPRKKYIGRLFRPPQAPWSSIQPIVHCRELTRLSLNCIRVAIELEELETFLQDRTTWTHLDIFTSRWLLRLQDLLLYAKYCPSLTHLGTFINTAVHIPLTELRPPSSPTFKALTCIDVARTIFLCYSHSEMGQFFYESCEKPVYFSGYSAKASHNISKSIASCYIEEEARSGVPMSCEAREYVTIVSKYEDPGVERMEHTRAMEDHASWLI